MKILDDYYEESKYIELFKEELMELFNIRKYDQFKKKGPYQILSDLMRRYLNRLDLPSKREIY